MIYFISFDPHKVDTGALHQVIKSSAHINDWWHYLGSTYLVSSSSSAESLQNEIAAKWPHQRFLIMKTDPFKYGGWLPKDGWEWIKKHQ